MILTMRKWLAPLCVSGLIGMGFGCVDGDDLEDILDELDDIEFEFNQNVDVIQDDDFDTIVLPSALDEEIIIEEEVTVITEIREDIIIEELPDEVIVGLENLTGLDGYYRYLADGVLQGVFVFEGETLLLDYPCLSDLEVLSEEYFDPFTGELVESFDLEGAFFENPFDFECGDAFIITFTPDSIETETTLLDLLD